MTVYDGSFGSGDIIQGETAREIQRMDLPYDEGKAWVDEQMVVTVTHNGDIVEHNGDTVIV